MSRPVKTPTAKMEPNAMPSLRLVDKPCWAVFALCVMLRGGTLEEDGVTLAILDYFSRMDEEKTDFSMRGAYADPRYGL